MYTRHDWPISFNAEQFIALQGPSFAALLRNPARRQSFEQALADITQVLRPAACWDDFPIKQILHERLVLANGKRIGSGPVIPVMGGAERLIVAICTVGPAVDRLILAAQQHKELFRAMLLHDLASWGVDMLRQQWCQQIEEEARRQGLRVSAPLSPGESAWGVKDQAVIFSLLDAAQIGVSLSSSLVMIPLKSISLIRGIGSQPMGVEGASACDFCSIKDRCTYRQRRI